MKLGKGGFTLIEMLAVIAIAGILITIIVPNVVSVISRAEKEATKVQVKSVKNAILNFYLEEGKARSLDVFLSDEVFNSDCTLKGDLDLNPYLDGLPDEEEGYASNGLDALLGEENIKKICESFRK